LDEEELKTGDGVVVDVAALTEDIGLDGVDTAVRDVGDDSDEVDLTAEFRDDEDAVLAGGDSPAQEMATSSP